MPPKGPQPCAPQSGLSLERLSALDEAGASMVACDVDGRR